MNEICGDNRFEIIAKAKKHLLDATNIDTSPKEMEVLDDFLFRCWQMGWLDRYDRKTENSSEKPNNCEDEAQIITDGTYLYAHDKMLGEWRPIQDISGHKQTERSIE